MCDGVLQVVLFRLVYDRILGRYAWMEYVPESTLIIVLGLLLGGLFRAAGVPSSTLIFDSELKFVRVARDSPPL